VKASVSRLVAASKALDREQRFVAAAALALLVAMFLPWYEKSVVVPGSRSFARDTISAFGAVSFVEAAIFLVSAGVLVLVLTRAEGGRFHLPGGDGTVIFAAGLWASALIFYRVFDRPDVSGEGGTVGIQWGFFVAFVCAGALAFAGQRMRAASHAQGPVREPRSRRPPPAPEPDPFADDYDDHEADEAEAGTEVVPASEARTAVAPIEPDEPELPRAPRDRAVRREDAEDLTFEGPDVVEPPPTRRMRPR
jgi:hypothetical protein